MNSTADLSPSGVSFARNFLEADLEPRAGRLQRLGRCRQCPLSRAIAARPRTPKRGLFVLLKSLVVVCFASGALRPGPNESI